MRLQRVSHHLLAERAWELREKRQLLRRALRRPGRAVWKRPLLTLDARLAKAPGVRAEIELVQAA